MSVFSYDLTKYYETARRSAAEGAVLLRNEENALPLKEGDVVSVFGRTQLNWYKSGTGSGGMVNINVQPDIIKSLRAQGVILNEELVNAYAAWGEEHPFDKGEGWAKEPWAQEEMPLTDKLVEEAAGKSSIAVVIIGRTAGEDKDNAPEAGSYYLTALEEEMLEKAVKNFERVAVVLNVGNIIDMKWVEKYEPEAVLYVWHGGEAGADGTADVLTGRVNPSGGLPDTIAYDIDDYPSTKNFGKETPPPPEFSPDTTPGPMLPFGGDRDVYAEDIYIGYRWFETAAKDKVLYPFGFGLSYTQFDYAFIDANIGEDMSVTVDVVNRGPVPGKARVLVFVKAPLGDLGRPSRVLTGYAKTGLLMPNGYETVTVQFSSRDFAGFDDSGVTGHKYAWVLEAGDYDIFVGSDVRSAANMLGFAIDETGCIEHTHSALAPVTPYKRLIVTEDGVSEEDTPLSAVDLKSRILENLPEERAYTGDRGIKLKDVYFDVYDIDEFIDQIPDEILVRISRGEGMSSPKGTAGAAGVFGGLSSELEAFGIPILCCTDGPSGLRLDAGTTKPDGTVLPAGIAFSMPNGACLASSFNDKLVEKLFTILGREMRSKHIDLILGPGVNIHRNPLNGRNFEYFSEDPLLTGKMAAAQLRGLHRSKVSGVLKHFTANNREKGRFALDSIISERALREIYLRGYEIATREGGCLAVMTTYGKVNGLFTAGSYDLTTVILRGEWGFQGIAMTDWWAVSATDENGFPAMGDRAAMIRAQNDLQMCTTDSVAAQDNVLESLQSGALKRSELHRVARNILDVIMRTNAIDRYLEILPEAELEEHRKVAERDSVNFA